jgi:hypothetical protein
VVKVKNEREYATKGRSGRGISGNSAHLSTRNISTETKVINLLS